MRSVLRRFRPVAWALIVGLTMAPVPVFGQEGGESSRADEGVTTAEGSQLLEQGVQQYNELEWDAAAESLQEAIQAGLSREDRATAYWYLAILSQARNRTEEAEEYLFEALRANPRLELPEELRGTDFEDLYRRAVARTDRTPPTIRVLPITNVQQGKPLTVTVEVTDDSPIQAVELIFSLPNARSATVIEMRPAGPGRWSGELPAAAMQEGRLIQYEVQATDEWLNVGTQSATVSVPRSGGGKGWLWLVLGLVGAAGGAAAYFFGLAPENGTTPGETGPGVTPSWPTSAPPGPPANP